MNALTRLIPRFRLAVAIAAAAVAWPPAQASAQDSPKTRTEARAENMHMAYEAYWGGLHVADFALSLENGGDTYENRFHLETRGITRFFTNMSVRAHSHGRIVTPPPRTETLGGVDNAANLPVVETYMAQAYRTEYTNSKHFRWVDIRFNTHTPAYAVTGTRPVPGREDDWDPTEKGPEVLEKIEPEKTIGANDPITMIAQMIAIVRGHLTGGPANGVAHGFDGRRRFDMGIDYLGPATRTIGNVKHDTYHVRVTPKPVAGFKERHELVWNESQYDFYLSRDGRFVPLQIVPVNRGPVLTMTRECTRPCEIKVEED